MTISTAAGVADAYSAGRHSIGYMRKIISTVANTNTAIDMSYSAGTPVANYYAAPPLTSSVLSASDGIYAGPPVQQAGFRKYLHKALFLPPRVIDVGVSLLYFHDIVMFYPFVDGDGGSQDMDNSIPIPRYGGEGCRIMFTCQGAGTASSNSVRVTYTNTVGVQKVIEVYLNANTPAGRIMTAHDNISIAAQAQFQVPVNNPYLGLMPGDTGVRSIDNIEFMDSIGGIFAASIVKPLAMVSVQAQTGTDGLIGSPIEIDFTRDRTVLPFIEDGANIYPALRTTVAGNAALFVAELSFIWG